MEVELGTIIEKIKKEGVGEAEKRSDEILSQAKRKAKEIVDAAEKEKGAIIDNGKKEAEKMKANGEESLRQASRDVLLGLKESIIGLFDTVLRGEVGDAFSADIIQKMILGLAEKFQKDGSSDVEVLLSDKDKKALEDALLAALKKKMSGGVTLKASPGVEKGFRIGKKGEESYYDFTDQAVAEAFKEFLNPRMKEILDAGAK